MEGVIVKAIAQRNYFLLKEALIPYDIFAQIMQLLRPQEAQQFFSLIQLHRLKDHQLLNIEGGTIYFFLNKGAYISSKSLKEVKAKSKESLGKARKKSQFKNLFELGEEKIDVSRFSFGNLENWFSETGKSLKFYIASIGHGNVLSLSSSNLPQKIYLKIKSYYAEKVKMITKFDIFEGVYKHVLQDHLADFKFVKVVFNEFLYTQQKRNDEIFFLKKGEVQLESNNHKKIIVKGPILLGDEKVANESARCITDCLVAYSLNKLIFQQILRKGYQQHSEKCTESALRAEYVRSSNQSEYVDHMRNKFSPPKDTPSSIGQKSGQIRKYFSNFINEQYEEFYEKKTNLMKDMGIVCSQPILYQIKRLHPKAPNYDVMNKKLKHIRIKKILAIKEKLQKRSGNRTANTEAPQHSGNLKSQPKRREKLPVAFF